MDKKMNQNELMNYRN